MNGVLLNLWLYQFITLVEGPIPLDYEEAFFYKQTADSTAITAAGFVLMNKNDFDYEVIFSEIKMYPIIKLLAPLRVETLPQCGNSRIFLSFGFCVKSILEGVEVL